LTFINDAFGLYRMGIIDSESLYKPRVYNEQISEIELEEKPEVDQDYVNDVFQRLFRDNRFSIKTINEYVKTLLKHQTRIKSSDLVINNHEDLTRLILIKLYAHHDLMCYKTELMDTYIIRNGIEYRDFIIVKRGNQHGK
jgi:hypothetical protein